MNTNFSKKKFLKNENSVLRTLFFNKPICKLLYILKIYLLEIIILQFYHLIKSTFSKNSYTTVINPYYSIYHKIFLFLIYLKHKWTFSKIR